MSNLSIGVYVAVGGVLALLVLGLFLKSLWKVPDPNVTGSFETHAVSPEWFAKFTIELEGAINRLEFDTGGELNLASAPGAKGSCLRLVSGGHLAPGSRYKGMS